MQKKILVLYTGGTIGMDYLDGGISLVPGLFKSQLDKLAKISHIDYTLIEYTNIIDSSEINLTNYQQITQDVIDNYAIYDGFVIVHGTDTMAYTASMLSFALHGLHKPVILTGAQLPLVHIRSDGWNNLINAFYAAAQEDLHEVAVSFNYKLFRGNRTQKISTSRFLGFNSLEAEPLADFGMSIRWNRKNWFCSPNEFKPIIPQDFRILDLSMRPGFTTEFIADTLANTELRLDGVILQTYGSGNLPIKHTKLINAIEKAITSGVNIINITQVIEGRVTEDYATSKIYQTGIINGKDMTVEAAIAKLTILKSLGLSNQDIQKEIGINYAGELTEKII